VGVHRADGTGDGIGNVVEAITSRSKKAFPTRGGMREDRNDFRENYSKDRYADTDPTDLPFIPTEDNQAIDQWLKSQDPAKSPYRP
jgi:hypothetical protein